MTDALDTRRKRAVFRATHRGTREMDWLLGRYAEARVASMDETALARFEQVMALPEPDLQGWLMDTDRGPSGEYAPELEAIRGFHGVGVTANKQI